jgi:hypothetical protein
LDILLKKPLLHIKLTNKMDNQNIVPQVNNDQLINQAQVVQGADGQIALKVKQTKLPEFWRTKSKDSIAANKFVKRIDNMSEANNWADNIAFSNFAMALRGSANTWLDSQVTLKGIKGDRKKWSIIKPFFKAEFAVESDDKLILDGLAFLAMKPSENVTDYFGQLNKMAQIISDAYISCTNNPEEPAPDNAGNVQIAELRRYEKECDDNIMQFVLLNLFRASLPNNLHSFQSTKYAGN